MSAVTQLLCDANLVASWVHESAEKDGLASLALDMT